MVALRDYLRRFRAVGVAGAAAPAGVPADRAAEARNELAPVFELLAEVEQEIAQAREIGAAEARRRIDEARHRAHDIVADARGRAVSVRAEAAAHARGEAGRASDEAVEAASLLITERAARHMSALVDGAVAAVVQDLTRGPA